MLLVAGSLMASSLGWSLALGCRPAAVLIRLLWYRFGLFLYSLSFFFRRVSASLRFALFTMDAMALWHTSGSLLVRVGRGVEGLRLLVCVSVWFFGGWL